MAGIRHTTTATLADEAGAEVNKAEWNADHVIDALAIAISKINATGTPDATTFLRGDGTWNAPAGSGDMVLASVQTVTGLKTFGSAGAVGKFALAGTTSGSTILNATAVASGTLTLPAATDTLVGKATTDTLTNKTLDDTSIITIKDVNLTIEDDVDTTKIAKFQMSGISTGVTRTYSFPDATTTLAGVTATQTLTNKTIDLASNTLTLTSLQLLTACSDETGTGLLVFATSPTFVTPLLGTPTSGVLTNCTGLPTAGIVDDAVTYAKIQNVSATDRILGRDTAGAGDIEEITPSAVKTMLAIVAADMSDYASATASFTNKTFNANGTGNSLTNIDIADHSATGTPSSSTFYRGDNTWSTPAGSGDMVLADVQTVTGAKTFGTIGGAVGKLILAGSTSGSSILNAQAVAGTTTMTLPTASATLVGKDTTDVLTNKSIDADGTGNVITNIENADIKAAAAIAVNKLAALSVSLPVKTDGSGFLTASALSYTQTFPIVMEVPNDTVCYPDIFTLGDAASKVSGFWLPNSATSALCFKCFIPRNLHGTPALKVAIYMLPRTTVANSTVNLTLSRIYVDTTEDVDAAFTAETAIDVELTSTADFLTIYEYDVTLEATQGEMFHGLLTRTPGAANDDFTEDLLIVWMEGRVVVSPV